MLCTSALHTVSSCTADWPESIVYTLSAILRCGVQDTLQVVVSGTHNDRAWRTFHCLTSFYDFLQYSNYGWCKLAHIRTLHKLALFAWHILGRRAGYIGPGDTQIQKVNGANCARDQGIDTSEPLPSFLRAVPTRPLPTRVKACNRKRPAAAFCQQRLCQKRHLRTRS